MIVLILGVSILLQLTAAVAALRLIPITGKRLGWMAIATAIVLMTVRRSITFTRLLTGEGTVPADPLAELVALAISALMVVGMVWVAPLFLSIREINFSLHRSNRALKTLSESNQALVRIHDEAELMQEICRIIVEIGGYRLAWVGFAEQDESRTVRPVAQHGFEEGYLDSLGVTWAHNEKGRGPSGRAIRSGKASVAQNIQTDPKFEPWREAALSRGYAASIALPLASNGDVFAVLIIYAAEPEAFDEEEQRLLTELANDLAYGLTSLRIRDERAHAEERLERLMQSAPDGILISDGGGRIVLVNEKTSEIFGYSEAELLGYPVEKLIPERYRQAHVDHRADYYNDPRTRMMGKDLELLARRKDGSEFPVEISLSHEETDGQVLATSIVRDVTERKEAEEAHKKSEERFRIVTERALAGVYIIQHGVFRYVNPALAETFGYKQEEIVDKLKVSDLVHPDDRQLVAENLRRRVEGETDEVRYQLRGVRKDGSEIECEVLGRRAEYEGHPAVIGTLLDITERKRNESRVRRQLSQLNALRQIDLAITSSLDPRVTFQVLLTQITEQLGVDAADILIFEPHTQTLRFDAGKGFRTVALQHTQLGLGKGYAGQAALRREIVSVPDLSKTEGGLSQSPRLGDEGFVSYYAVPLVAKGAVKGVIEVFHRQPLDPDQEWLDFLEALAGQAAIAIDNAILFDELNSANADLLRAYDATLEGWARALELRDIETEGHSQRVTEMTVRLARHMGVPSSDLMHLRRGALLHDIGKMGIPDSILHKPGKLDEAEWEIMERHPRYAYEMLSPIGYLRPALDIPYCHHEKWDGSGYPRELKGEEIPLPARIFAVIDVWDALRSDRPYREAWSDKQARDHIRKQVGIHFDPAVVDAFFELLGEFADQKAPSQLSPALNPN